MGADTFPMRPTDVRYIGFKPNGVSIGWEKGGG